MFEEALWLEKWFLASTFPLWTKDNE
jgi:hypothetical protein